MEQEWDKRRGFAQAAFSQARVGPVSLRVRGPPAGKSLYGGPAFASSLVPPYELRVES